MRKSIFSDLGEFILALFPLTVTAITGGIIAAMLAIYLIFGYPVYAWLAWLFIVLVLFSAAFSAWRDQYKKVCTKNKNALLMAMIDFIKSDKAATIAALIKFSDQIETEADLKWFCAEFERLDYKNPLKGFIPILDSEIEGKWLPILVEAKQKPQEIRAEYQFVEFLALHWTDKEKWARAKAIYDSKSPRIEKPNLTS